LRKIFLKKTRNNNKMRQIQITVALLNKKNLSILIKSLARSRNLKKRKATKIVKSEQNSHLFHSIKEPSTKVNGLWETEMASENKFGLMVRFMKVSGSKIEVVGQEN